VSNTDETFVIGDEFLDHLMCKEDGLIGKKQYVYSRMFCKCFLHEDPVGIKHCIIHFFMNQVVLVVKVQSV
jgi:hypothetical protein